MSDTEIRMDKNLKGYLFIWFGQSISLLGSAIVQFAIIWWLTIETGSALILSLATFAGFLPMVIISPFAGVLIDRWNRKVVLIGTDIFQALATLGLISLFFLDIVNILHVLILLAIRGTCQAFQMPASMSIITLMVPENKISRINALNSILNSLVYIASPGIGAILLDFSIMQNILWLDVFTFIPAAVAIILVFIPVVKQVASNDARPSFKTEFIEGIIYLKGSSILPLVILGTVFNIFANPLFSLLPLFIMQVHSGGSTEFAFTEMMFYAGLLSGSMFLVLWKNFTPKVSSWVVSIFLLSISIILLALVPAGNFLLLGVIILFAGVLVSLVDVQILSLFQLTTPADLQGRVFSTAFMIIKSIYTVALIFIGVLAEMAGIPLLFIVFPVVTILIMLVMVLKTPLMQLNGSNVSLSAGKTDSETIPVMN
ncbi:MAG: MFS transporter [Candidatus Odinarchaeota archaeon]